MHKSSALLHTKICLPFVRPSLVGRPRLQKQIGQGLRVPLTLIIAPAGFGKTTLTASSVARFGMSVAWLSLDQSDNLDGHFLTYMIAALQSADSQIGSDAARLIAGIEHASPQAVLTSLINDLESVDKEMVLVLDDYQ